MNYLGSKLYIFWVKCAGNKIFFRFILIHLSNLIGLSTLNYKLYYFGCFVGNLKTVINSQSHNPSDLLS